MSAHVLGVLIPIIAIVMGLGCVMLAMYFDFRKRREMFQLYHAERMAAIEKGIELPPLPEEFFRVGSGRPLPARHRRFGLILLFLGVALTVALWGDGDPFLWGLLPVALGLAYLLAALLEAREQKDSPATPAEDATQTRIGRM